MQAFLGTFAAAAPAVLDVVIADAGSRASRAGDASPNAPRIPIFSSLEDINGEVKVAVNGGKRLDHGGLRIELKGVIDLVGEKAPYEFVSHVRELAPPGQLTGLAAFRFAFPRPELPHESYAGKNARVRYFLRAIAAKAGGGFGSGSLTKEFELIVQNPGEPPAAGAPIAGGNTDVALAAGGSGDGGIKLEVGIEDCLHIEFEYARTRYHLRDVVYGSIDFFLVRIRIAYMELSVVRKETVGQPGTSLLSDSTVLMKYEVMDGAPVKGDRIPIKVPLSGLDLSPTLVGAANGQLNVKYFLNLVLVDDEGRRYFKSAEVLMWRKDIDVGQ